MALDAMAVAVATKHWTLEELDSLPDDVNKYELIHIYRPRAVIQLTDSQMEPDLFVRQPQSDRAAGWKTASLPSLVVEVLSPSTRRRDREHKRRFYLELGIPEYWIIDPDGMTITAIRAGRADVTSGDRLEWTPPGAQESLAIDVSAVFG